MESIPQENLAAIKRRFAALCIDCGLILFPLTASPAGWLGLAAITQLGDPSSLTESTVFVILGIVIAIALVGIGSFVWLLVAAGRGMTPGKQITGLHVVNLDGHTATRGKMLRREALAKAPLLLLLGGFSAGFALSFLITFGIIDTVLRNDIVRLLLLTAFVVDNCWAFRNAGRQTVHDRIMGTFVVTGRG